MQTTVELQDMFSYAWIPILVMILLLCVIVVVIIVICSRKPKNRIPVVRPVPIKNIFVIKEKYERILLEIAAKYQEHKITERVAYFELSKAIRHFVYEVTGIRVQFYTLEEIKMVNMPNLYYLIAECYVPEFAKEKHGDIHASIEKARKVIREWN